MFRSRWSTRSALCVALATGITVACSDDGDPTAPGSSPLSGLTREESRDSVGNPPPPPPSGTLTPGIVRGTVLGPSTPGAGNDSLETAPRVAGVVVTAYPVVQMAPEPELGPAAASATTDANGRFQLPQLAGGEYVVTFNPPASSEYGGVWVTTVIHGGSNEYPWWVVLWKK